MNLFCIWHAGFIWGSRPPDLLTKGEVHEQFPPWQSPLMAVGTTFQGGSLRAGFGGGCEVDGRLILAAEGWWWFGLSLYQVLVGLVWRVGIS